jgi:hypothetical protein
MNIRLVGFATVMLASLLGVETLQLAQDAAPSSAKPDQERRSDAIGLLRTIKTAEAEEFINNGSYLSWSALFAHQPKYFNGWIPKFYSENPHEHFRDAPEILPRCNLRLNVHAGGKGYDLMLQDLTDKTCGYAAVTDESGVIGQRKAIVAISRISTAFSPNQRQKFPTPDKPQLRLRRVASARNLATLFC